MYEGTGPDFRSADLVFLTRRVGVEVTVMVDEWFLSGAYPVDEKCMVFSIKVTGDELVKRPGRPVLL